MKLLIVESPAKAKTVNKYLGKEYKVLASFGHVRDLASKNGSVDPENHFAMTWEMSAKGKKCLSDISKALQNADELILATDPDREGEAIAWHIYQALSEKKKLKIPVKRVVFHEVTQKAIRAAISSPRDIDQALVDAYLSRRALDYLVGFTISPLLWRRMPGSKSAGRVQSVALRMIVDREDEIDRFKSQEYWTLKGLFQNTRGNKFQAKLHELKNKSVEKMSFPDHESAQHAFDLLNHDEYCVSAIEEKATQRKPYAPFTTSTLQQEAARKLHFSTKRTMSLAQNLYEGIDIDGQTIALITYMRTDSVHLSDDAVKCLRQTIRDLYGEEYVPEKAVKYTNKVKNAQEAHEAIRPVDASFTPDMISGKVDASLYKLYTLIWKRTVASQMQNAKIDNVRADLQGKNGVFRATGHKIAFPGFLKVYDEDKDAESSNDSHDTDEEKMLPPLQEGDRVVMESLDMTQSFTQPPPRFSEATLVKNLEANGIGRPSTYATIIQVLQSRGYVKMEKRTFFPEIRGRLLIAFLMEYFRKYIEYDFTADMEQQLDEVSNCALTKDTLLQNFWTPFYATATSMKSVRTFDIVEKINVTLHDLLFKNIGKGDRSCPDCSDGILSLKMSKFGSFVGCSNYPECKFVQPLDGEARNDDIEESTKEDNFQYPIVLGHHSITNEEISLRKGPYGLYVQTNNNHEIKRASIHKSICDGSNISIQMAEFLLSLPKTLGKIDGDDVKIGIGRYGPYVQYQGKFFSINKSFASGEALSTFSLTQAIQIIQKKKKRS